MRGTCWIVWVVTEPMCLCISICVCICVIFRLDQRVPLGRQPLSDIFRTARDPISKRSTWWQKDFACLYFSLCVLARQNKSTGSSGISSFSASLLDLSLHLWISTYCRVHCCKTKIICFRWLFSVYHMSKFQRTIYFFTLIWFKQLVFVCFGWEFVQLQLVQLQQAVHYK